MPLHDWTHAYPGLFHHFHQDWTLEIARFLNRGLLPRGIDAILEERPRLKIMGPHSDEQFYAQKASRIICKQDLSRTLAVIAVLSRGDKLGRSAVRVMVEETVKLLREGVHFLLIDLFPPSRWDPFGLHGAICEEMSKQVIEVISRKDRLLVSYRGDYEGDALVRDVGVGKVFPDMPLFLGPDLHVTVPLEATYQASWDACPQGVRDAALFKLPAEASNT